MRQHPHYLVALTVAVILTGCQATAPVRPTWNTDFQTTISSERWTLTNKPLDWVIDNTANNPSDLNFFELVSDGDGSFALTRYGAFRLDEKGTIVHESGRLLNPQVTLPADASDVMVREDGTVGYRQAGKEIWRWTGPIQLVRVKDPAGLRPMGNGLYAHGDSGLPQQGYPASGGFGKIRGGWLERQN
jgi:flagellar basal-body rod protein FlgG